MRIFNVERLLQLPSKITGRLDAARVDDLKIARHGDRQTELSAEQLKIRQSAGIMVGVDYGDGAAAAFGKRCDTVGIAAVRRSNQSVDASKRCRRLIAIAGEWRQITGDNRGGRGGCRNDETNIGVRGIAR